MAWSPGWTRTARLAMCPAPLGMLQCDMLHCDMLSDQTPAYFFALPRDFPSHGSPALARKHLQAAKAV